MRGSLATSHSSSRLGNCSTRLHRIKILKTNWYANNNNHFADQEWSVLPLAHILQRRGNRPRWTLDDWVQRRCFIIRTIDVNDHNYQRDHERIQTVNKECQCHHNYSHQRLCWLPSWRRTTHPGPSLSSARRRGLAISSSLQGWSSSSSQWKQWRRGWSLTNLLLRVLSRRPQLSPAEWLQVIFFLFFQLRLQ